MNTINGGTRFLHYIIDFAITYALAVVMTAFMGPSFLRVFVFPMHIGSSWYEVNLLYPIITLLYYAILESTIGRTVGKFATNSYVIDEYANLAKAPQIILRSFCRFIPFNAFSCLGDRGWHDMISKTYVVSKTEWNLLKKGISEDNDFADDSEILDS